MQAQQQEGEETTLPLSSHTGRNSSDQSVVSSETLRVTPEEVALAAAALEAKRDAEHTWRETSLPLGEAIHYLGLNATPQELAPEVAALRTERSRRAIKAKRDKIRNVAGVGAGIGIFLAVVLGLWRNHSMDHRQYVVTPAPPASPMTALPLQKLAAVPDNVPVHVDVDTLLRLAKGNVTPENVSVDVRSEDTTGAQAVPRFDNEWTLVKSKGQILVQGWATVEYALSLSNGSTGSLFSARPGWLPANSLLPTQVPIARLEGQSYVRYMSDGVVTENSGNSVLMAVNVADNATVAKDLVEAALQTADAKFAGDVTRQLLYFDVRCSDNVVHITGRGATASLKKRTTEIAVSALRRLNLPYTVSNDIKIENEQ